MSIKNLHQWAKAHDTPSFVQQFSIVCDFPFSILFSCSGLCLVNAGDSIFSKGSQINTGVLFGENSKKNVIYSIAWQYVVNVRCEKIA